MPRSTSLLSRQRTTVERIDIASEIFLDYFEYQGYTQGYTKNNLPNGLGRLLF
ncbi:hypothetical protein GCM10008933_10210 [Paenibacillus motobuensis]|uniref:Uncharacterized protein n=1 Tax=Paenibacillus motobuensis TaxID=295324 RepID=A0ABN0Y2J0_9BACL